MLITEKLSELRLAAKFLHEYFGDERNVDIGVFIDALNKT